MCTALTYKTNDHYFGRTLDYQCSFGESVTITPRNKPLTFRKKPTLTRHFAMLGMAHMESGYPLYYEATNEKGLSMAGLRFQGNAVYHPAKAEMDNLTPFELIPWILGQCATAAEACKLLKNTNLLSESFREDLPLSPLHWLIADKRCAFVAEPLSEGLSLIENPVGVLTNNPPFATQMFLLRHFAGLSAEEPGAGFSPKIPAPDYSRGMGALGLPGDFSSVSRFVRAAFVKCNGVSGDTEAESICQMFHMLGAVSQPRGVVRLKKDEYVTTRYTSCCNTDKGIYYYTTYENSCPAAVSLYKEDLEKAECISYPLAEDMQVQWQN